jgi:hypothetical protein
MKTNHDFTKNFRASSEESNLAVSHRNKFIDIFRNPKRLIREMSEAI